MPSSGLSASELRPPKPDLLLGGPWPVWPLLSAGILIVGILFAAWIIARRHEQQTEPGFGQQGSTDGSAPRGKLKRAYTLFRSHPDEQLPIADLVVEALRDLVVLRFGLTSARLTTTELLSELTRSGADQAFCRDFLDVLEACDLIRFAGVRLPKPELAIHLATARLLLPDEIGRTAAAEVQEQPGPSE